MSRSVAELSAHLETLLQRVEPRAEAEELVRTVVSVYGEGLTRLLELLREHDDGDNIIDALCRDELLTSLLIVHDLHPVPLETRIERALDGVRPYLRSHGGEVAVAGISDDGVVELRLSGTCDGCPSSSATMQLAVERAILAAAPEIAEVRANAPRDQALPLVSTWMGIDSAADLAPYSYRALKIDGTKVLLVRGDADLYAYRNRCPSCFKPFDASTLAWPQLVCAACDSGFDIVHAGQGLHAHLEPLPLQRKDGAVRIAVPAGA